MSLSVSFSTSTGLNESIRPLYRLEKDVGKWRAERCPINSEAETAWFRVERRLILDVKEELERFEESTDGGRLCSDSSVGDLDCFLR